MDNSPVKFVDGKPFCVRCNKQMMPIDQFIKKKTEYDLKYGPYRAERVDDEIFSNDNRCYHGGYAHYENLGTILNEMGESLKEDDRQKLIMMKLRVQQLQKENNISPELVLKAMLKINEQCGNPYTPDEMTRIFYDAMMLDETV